MSYEIPPYSSPAGQSGAAESHLPYMDPANTRGEILRLLHTPTDEVVTARTSWAAHSAEPTEVSLHLSPADAEDAMHDPKNPLWTQLFAIAKGDTLIFEADGAEDSRSGFIWSGNGAEGRPTANVRAIVSYPGPVATLLGRVFRHQPHAVIYATKEVPRTPGIPGQRRSQENGSAA